MSDVNPEIMKQGAAAYPLCQACHGAKGEGVPNLGPPLAGSEWVLGPKENLIRMQFRGLMGPIEVKGVEWNGVMAPNAPALGSDEKIAAVLTYVRNSWGNEASIVTAEEVSKFRGEIGKPMLTVADLIDPKTAPKEAATPAAGGSAGSTAGTAAGSAAAPPQPVESKVDAGAQKIANQLKEEVGTADASPAKLEDYPTGISLGSVGFGVWVLICLVPVLIGFITRNSD